MARKTKEDAQKTRDQILDGAEFVLLEKGLAHATMADFAVAAGVSRGAVYGHYKSKMEVCQAMIDRAFALDALRFPGAVPSAIDTLVNVGRYYLVQFLEPGPAQRVTTILYYKCELSDENHSILRRRNLMDRMTLRYIRHQLRRAMVQNELPATLALGLCTDYLLVLFEGLYDLLERGPSVLPTCEAIMRGALEGLHSARSLHKK